MPPGRFSTGGAPRSTRTGACPGRSCRWPPPPRRAPPRSASRSPPAAASSASPSRSRSPRGTYRPRYVFLSEEQRARLRRPETAHDGRRLLAVLRTESPQAGSRPSPAAGRRDRERLRRAADVHRGRRRRDPDRRAAGRAPPRARLRGAGRHPGAGARRGHRPVRRAARALGRDGRDRPRPGGPQRPAAPLADGRSRSGTRWLRPRSWASRATPASPPSRCCSGASTSTASPWTRR